MPRSGSTPYVFCVRKTKRIVKSFNFVMPTFCVLLFTSDSSPLFLSISSWVRKCLQVFEHTLLVTRNPKIQWQILTPLTHNRRHGVGRLCGSSCAAARVPASRPACWAARGAGERDSGRRPRSLWRRGCVCRHAFREAVDVNGQAAQLYLSCEGCLWTFRVGTLSLTSRLSFIVLRDRSHSIFAVSLRSFAANFIHPFRCCHLLSVIPNFTDWKADAKVYRKFPMNVVQVIVIVKMYGENYEMDAEEDSSFTMF